MNWARMSPPCMWYARAAKGGICWSCAFMARAAARKLKQREIAEQLGIPQPKVLALMNYRLDQFSVECLMGF
ncbi:MAG: XRE family transcriptional regulator [Alcaligenaceae bacterium]|nr:XRE family transcriptional regulator [Alcaligenaceae bacterium]